MQHTISLSLFLTLYLTYNHWLMLTLSHKKDKLGGLSYSSDPTTVNLVCFIYTNTLEPRYKAVFRVHVMV